MSADDTSCFSVYLVTWNVGEARPCKDFADLLSLHAHSLPNMYAVGLQELKSTAASLLIDAVFDDPWTNALTQCLSARDYVRVRSLRMAETHLVIFIRRTDLPFVMNIESTYARTGVTGFWGGKGAVSIRMDVYGVSLCIVNVHFRAHRENYAGRVMDYCQVMESQRFEAEPCPTVLHHDYVFVMGDFNFRTDELSASEVKDRIAAGNLQSLWTYDQLNYARNRRHVLLDFDEGPLSFRPTFKYDVGSHEYDTSGKSRVPSWCDRILWHVHTDAYCGVDLAVELTQYTSVDDYVDSDHKPVIAICSLLVLGVDACRPAEVIFERVGEWSRCTDNTVHYVTESRLPLSSRDWIGLYKSDYRHWYDYVTYQWASQSVERVSAERAMYSVTFPVSCLSSLDATFYYLLYFSSRRRCVIAYSDPLKLCS